MALLAEWKHWIHRESARAAIFGGSRLRFYLVADYIRSRRDPLRPPRPRMIQLEPAGICNLRCYMCLRTGQAESNGEMGFDTFEEIMRAGFDYRHFTLLYGQGEPLLCKDLFRMIRFERERGNYVVTVTNGTLLNEGMCDQIASSGLNMLRISIDGACEETYQRIRKGASLGRVLKGIETLRRVISARRAKTELAVTFMALKENRHEAAAMVELTHHLGIRTLEIKDLPPYLDSPVEPLSVAMERDPELAREVELAMSAAEREAAKRGIRLITSKFGRPARDQRCMNPWFKTYITAQGYVTPCSKLCFSPDAVLGRLPDDDFEAIWRGGRYRRIRENALAGAPPLEGCRML